MSLFNLIFISALLILSTISYAGDDEIFKNGFERQLFEIYIDEFNGMNPLLTTVSNGEALPQVTMDTGRYTANLLDNTNNITLHFNQDQGRLDAMLLKFPFEFIARNIGIGTLGDSQVAPSNLNNPYYFSGVQVHSLNLDEPNSSHVVVGHRGTNGFTIEGKNTVSGNSTVNDIGANQVMLGRADIKIVGNNDRTLTVFWQNPNLNPDTQADNWSLYGPSWNPNPDGSLPGNYPQYDSEVYIGLITYAYTSSANPMEPFVGTCDGIEVVQFNQTSQSE